MRLTQTVVLLVYSIICTVKGEIIYKIVAPEFICVQNMELGKNQKEATTIELIGDAKVDFFKLNFKRMSDPCRNTQRCNLVAWKVVRRFEKFLNDYPYSETNSIRFNNSMLVPGLKYILTVFISQGNEREQRQLALNFVDDHYMKSSSKPLVSVTLVGVSSASAHNSYIINADAKICSDIENFYFRWELLDGSNSLINEFPDRSSELIIPPFTLQGGREYHVKCYLTDWDTKESIAESIHSINVKNGVDSLLVKLPMIYTTVKVRQTISIRPYVRDLANQDDNLKKKWSCVYNNADLCENHNSDELYIEGGFLNPGEYNISLTVTKGAEIKTAFGLIKVLEDVPSIEIDTIETPVVPSSGIRIKANVEELRTFCTVQWKMEKGPFDLNSVPGNLNAIQHVVTSRDLFLRELEEFSSDVVNREYDLIIPPPTGNWKGLPNPDEDYNLQFLLEVKCARTQLEDNNVEIELSDEFFNDTTTISALIEINVVVPPKLKPFEVIPETGIALETLFTYKCEEPVKSGVTGPFLYKYGYLLNEREFVFSSLLGFRKAETILPYGDAVKTFVVACDGLNSCSKIFGPTIKTSLPTTIDEQKMLNVFKEKLNMEDFVKAFGYALTILTATEEVEQYNDHFSNELLSKIQYLLSIYNGDDENWGRIVNKLITSIKEFSKELSFSEDVLNGLAQLREKLLMDQKMKLFLQRNLLSTKKKLTLENFKSYIEVSDLIITSSSNDEKVQAEKLLLDQKIKEFLGKLCTQLYEKQQTILLEYETVVLVVEKLPKKSFNNMHVIPFAGNSWNTTAEVKLDIKSLEKLEKDKLCVSKMLFNDYFNKPGTSYGAMVLDGDAERLMFDPIQSTVLIPVDNRRIADETPKCLIYKDGWSSNCTFEKIVANFAQCSCPMTGVYYLDYTKTTPVATESNSENSVVSVQVTRYEESTVKLPVGDELTTSLTINIQETTNKGGESDTATNSYDFHTKTNSISENTVVTTKVVPEYLTTITQNLNDVTDALHTLFTEGSSTQASVSKNMEFEPSSTYSFSLDSNTQAFDRTSTGTTEISSKEDTTEDISTEIDVATTNLPVSECSSSSNDTTASLTSPFPSFLNLSSTIDPNISTTASEEHQVTTEWSTTENTSEDSLVTVVPTTMVSDGSVTVDSETNTGIVNVSLTPIETTSSTNKANTLDLGEDKMKSSTKNTVKEVTAVTAAVETNGKTETTPFRGLFQAGINANFYTNFSVKFSINTTFGR